MAIEHKTAQHRGFFREDVDIPATLFLLASDDMRRTVKIVNLSGSGCAVRINSLEPISLENTHQIRFELPNKSEALYFDCQLIRAVEVEAEGGQDLFFHFVEPQRAFQDTVISYLNNKKRYERTAWRVAIPVTIASQTGLRAFKPYKGTTVEAGRLYAVCEFKVFELATSSEAVVTFTAPGYRDDIFFISTISKVDHTPAGYKVRVQFDSAGDKMLDFIRKYYGAKAKPINIVN